MEEGIFFFFSSDKKQEKRDPVSRAGERKITGRKAHEKEATHSERQFCSSALLYLLSQ